MSHHLVECRDLRYAYPDGTPALDGVTFRITHGESVALLGANGAGKSTLILHLAGFLFPAAGECRVGDVPVTPRSAPSARRTLGLVFQDPDDQLFMPRVRDDVAFGPANLGLPPGEVARRVDACLDKVGALHLADRASARLSVGEKKRVALAATLALAPDILVLDEPSAGLDPAARRKLIDLLRGFDHTRIVATHDLDLALETTGRAILLARGRVAADGPTRTLLTDAALLSSCGLEPPPSLKACPRCGGR